MSPSLRSDHSKRRGISNRKMKSAEYNTLVR